MRVTRRSVLLVVAIVAIFMTVATAELLGRRSAALGARLDLIEERQQADAMAHTAAENDLRERLTALETRATAKPAHVSAPPRNTPPIGKRIARRVVGRFRKGKDRK